MKARAESALRDVPFGAVLIRDGYERGLVHALRALPKSKQTGN